MFNFFETHDKIRNLKHKLLNILYCKLYYKLVKFEGVTKMNAGIITLFSMFEIIFWYHV